MRPTPFGVLAGRVFHHAFDEADVLRHPRDQVIVGGVAAARAVAVQMRETIAPEIEAELVDIPGRAGEAARRMAGPPGDAHAALEPVAMAPQHARDLEHAGVAGGVVA